MSKADLDEVCKILDLIRRTAPARVALGTCCDDGLGLVRAVKPCASRTALRLRGLTAQPAQAGWAFMCNARACDDPVKISTLTLSDGSHPNFHRRSLLPRTPTGLPQASPLSLTDPVRMSHHRGDRRSGSHTGASRGLRASQRAREAERAGDGALTTYAVAAAPTRRQQN